MFFILRSERASDDEGGYLEVDDFVDGGVGLDEWGKGLPLSTKRSAFAVMARAVRGYKGRPADFYCFRIPLMSERMVKVLHTAGVDNIDTYPVTLIERMSGRRRPLFAVNILGRVAAANMSQSEWSCDSDPPMRDVLFEKLVLSSTVPGDFLMFRMAESLSTILVHESVKQALEQAGLTGVELVAPADGRR